MVTKKHLVLAVLVTVCLMLPLFQTLPAISQGEYDPWADINNDGTIDIFDIVRVAVAFGASGNPNKPTTEVVHFCNSTEYTFSDPNTYYNVTFEWNPSDPSNNLIIDASWYLQYRFDQYPNSVSESNLYVNGSSGNYDYYGSSYPGYNIRYILGQWSWIFPAHCAPRYVEPNQQKYTFTVMVRATPSVQVANVTLMLVVVDGTPIN